MSNLEILLVYRREYKRSEAQHKNGKINNNLSSEKRSIISITKAEHILVLVCHLLSLIVERFFYRYKRDHVIPCQTIIYRRNNAEKQKLLNLFIQILKIEGNLCIYLAQQKFRVALHVGIAHLCSTFTLHNAYSFLNS